MPDPLVVRPPAVCRLGSGGRSLESQARARHVADRGWEVGGRVGHHGAIAAAVAAPKLVPVLITLRRFGRRVVSAVPAAEHVADLMGKDRGWNSLGNPTKVATVLVAMHPGVTPKVAPVKVARWQNLIPSISWIAPGWRAWGCNPRKGRDPILQRSVSEP